MPLAEDLRVGPERLGHACRPGSVGPAARLAGLALISRLGVLHPL